MKERLRNIDERVLIVPLWNWNSYRWRRSVWRGGLNRTFMELKPRWGYPLHRLQRVLIVPLWNWNEEKRQEYFRLYPCLNRTFMELKQQGHTIFWQFDYGLNRTFMELKPNTTSTTTSTTSVLIVPLWNWNEATLAAARLLRRGLNRTFMELKRVKGPFSGAKVAGLNRTFMELKQPWCVATATSIVS